MKNDTTKQALANALKQLLQKKQITKITINDIAEACGISRMTFYYHFKDIYDLADWTLQEALHTAIADNRIGKAVTERCNNPLSYATAS